MFQRTDGTHDFRSTAGADLEGCARRGTAYAAGTLARLGPLLPPPDAIEALARAVRIERLADA